MFELDGQFQLVMEYVVGKDAQAWTEALPDPLSARRRPGSASSC